jgi:predicted RNA-binding protein YlqC (UPF0109 family)
MERDQAFLEFVIKSLVNYPDDVKVERQIDEMGVLLKLQVNRADMGQIVGRQGATAKAIRSLLRIVGLKNNARVNLKILEPEGGSMAQAGSEQAPQASSGQPSDIDRAMEDLKNL